jgi:hypothetical protein
MPYFSQELDVYVDEFIDECSTSEIEEMIESLEERGFIKPNSSTKLEYVETSVWTDIMLKIMNNKHQLSPDDEELIRNIHSKLV